MPSTAGKPLREYLVRFKLDGAAWLVTERCKAPSIDLAFVWAEEYCDRNHGFEVDYIAEL
ncbi:hypothetical protein V8O11_22205 [Erwinia aphidicola]|uniref:hypothetical protein n=1 Tax=Erwinia aphidicola TaxID=68334 RepID=UPI00300C0049